MLEFWILIALHILLSFVEKVVTYDWLHCKKRLAIFLAPAGMLLTELSLARNNLIISGQGEFG